jgi:hypothetical protein
MEKQTNEEKLRWLVNMLRLTQPDYVTDENHKFLNPETQTHTVEVIDNNATNKNDNQNEQSTN